MASEGKRRRRRGWAEFCALQGLEPLELPGMTLSARYRAVGNAVPLPVARAFAAAIRLRTCTAGDRRVTACECGCGRPVDGRRRLATGGCRQRMLRRRHAVASGAHRCVTELVSQDLVQ
jgi:DNA (cytosine-5)-methyltransferase 1